MIFHENRLLTDNSYEISALIFQKLGKMSQYLSSAKVLIGALKVKNSPSFENKGKWARLRWLSDYFSQNSP